MLSWGKICKKPILLQSNTEVSCKCSPKPIQVKYCMEYELQWWYVRTKFVLTNTCSYVEDFENWDNPTMHNQEWLEMSGLRDSFHVLTMSSQNQLNSQNCNPWTSATTGSFYSEGRYLYLCVQIYIYIYIWLVVSTPLKNISQLGWLFPIYGKIKNVPNHQPDYITV